MTLTTGATIRLLEVEYLLAFKLDAFRDRGRADPQASFDLEDITALLDGHQELEARVRAATNELRRYIAAGMRDIREEEQVFEALVAQLPRGGDERGRRKRLIGLVQRLAALS